MPACIHCYEQTKQKGKGEEMSYLTANNVVKNFKNLKALKGVDVDVEKGELVTLLGPSGCGKSTLLRIIAGLETLDSGDITINGKSIVGLPANKRNLGMVFQQYSLFPNMTVAENVAFGLKMKKVPDAEIKTKVEEMLSLVELSEKNKSYPDELSGGQQQRVAIARALVVQPDVLLLDEPLSALDAKIRLSLRTFIRDIQQKLKITTIFVTHDQEEAMSVSDRIFVMDAGVIVQSGKPQEMYQNPNSKFVAGFLGTFNFLKPEMLGLAAGSPQVLVRPEHIEILPDGGEGRGIFRGIVQNVFFLGNISRLKVLVGDTIVLIDTLNTESDNFAAGQNITIRIPDEKFIQFKD